MEVAAIKPFDVLDEAEQEMVTGAFDFVGDPSQLCVYEVTPHTGRRYRLVAPADAAIGVGSQVSAGDGFDEVLGVNSEGRRVQICGTSRLVLDRES